MWKDEIVDETRRAREAYAASLNYDLEAIYRDLKAKERKSGHPVVSLHPKPPLQLNTPKTHKAEAA
jgi:hypothetical protein